jgi:hypothetical protein
LLAPFLRSLEQEIHALRRLRSTTPPTHAITLRAPKIVSMIWIKASRENLRVFSQEVVRYVPFETRRRVRENARDALAAALPRVIAARRLSTEERYGSIQLVKAMKDVVVTCVLSDERDCDERAPARSLHDKDAKAPS